MHLFNMRDKDRITSNPAHISGIEYEFKLADGGLSRHLAADAEGRQG